MRRELGAGPKEERTEGKEGEGALVLERPLKSAGRPEQ